MFMWCSMLVEGSELNIEIHKKHSQLWKKLIREPGSGEEPVPKANIKFDDLRKHLSSRTGTNREIIFTLIAPSLSRGPQQISRCNLIIRSKNYNCGWSSRYAIIVTVVLIPSSNIMVEPRH